MHSITALLQTSNNIFLLLLNVSVERKFLCPNRYIKKKIVRLLFLHRKRLEQMVCLMKNVEKCFSTRYMCKIQ